MPTDAPYGSFRLPTLSKYHLLVELMYQWRSASCASIPGSQHTTRIPTSPTECLYLHTAIKPLYRFIRDQGYESVDGKFVRRERDHDRIIGYDDVNQLFWYPEGFAHIVLVDKVCQPFMTRINVLISLCQTRLVDIPPARRFMRFDRFDWNRNSSRRITRNGRSGICSSTSTESGSSTSHCSGSTPHTTPPPYTSQSEAIHLP